MIGTGDYNGDGKSDILFQNSSGEVAIWELNGTTVIASGSLGNPSPTWHCSPTMAFISRSMPICPGRPTAVPLFSYRTTAARHSSGPRTVPGSHGAGSLGNPGPDWHVKATGDFNGDGNPDLLWQNDTGEAFIWELNGTTLIPRRQPGQSGPELAHHLGRRFQPRWPIGHPVAEQQRRGALSGK